MPLRCHAPHHFFMALTDRVRPSPLRALASSIMRMAIGGNSPLFACFSTVSRASFRVKPLSTAFSMRRMKNIRASMVSRWYFLSSVAAGSPAGVASAGMSALPATAGRSVWASWVIAGRFSIVLTWAFNHASRCSFGMTGSVMWICQIWPPRAPFPVTFCWRILVNLPRWIRFFRASESSLKMSLIASRSNQPSIRASY